MAFIYRYLPIFANAKNFDILHRLVSDSRLFG